MNGYDSSKLIIKHGVPQGSVLGPLLFLISIYINDLHKSTKHCTVRHFADDTNLLISNNSPKQLQLYLNYEFKIKMNGKKLYPSKFVKYLGVIIDSNLNFSFHINSVS